MSRKTETAPEAATEKPVAAPVKVTPIGNKTGAVKVPLATRRPEKAEYTFSVKHN
jgi:hypothetical protein